MDHVLSWLLSGDVSLQYQTHAGLLDSSAEVVCAMQSRIASEGFGARLLAHRSPNGHWGLWYYQPKWTCTHYTLCDLKDLGLAATNQIARTMIDRAFAECRLPDGGMNFAKTMRQGDMAINGMFLDYASYFCPSDERLASLAASILSHRKSDGAFSWDNDALTSDPHTTLCVLEGLLSHQRNCEGVDDYRQIIQTALTWLYRRNLCIGEDRRFTRLAHPYRYRYDLLRLLDFSAKARVALDEHIEKALTWLLNKQVQGVWDLELVHPGKTHFPYETVGKPSRFITCKALRIMKFYAAESKAAALAWSAVVQKQVPVPSTESTG